MNIRNRLRTWAILSELFILAAFTACGGAGVPTPTQEAHVPITPSPTVALTTLQTPTMPTQSPTNTVEPSPTILTPTNTVEPSPTIPTPTNTAQPTLSPTRSPTQQAAYLLELLANNGGCKLPCWWGALPGTAKWADFALQNRIGLANYEMLLSVGPADVSNLSVLFGVDGNGVIQSTSVQASGLNVPGTDPLHATAFTALMQKYGLEDVLRQYGTPSRVYLVLQSFPAEQGAPWIYSMWLLFDNQGFMVVYEGEGMSHDGRMLRVCPSYAGVHTIEIHSQSPVSQSPVENLEQLMNGQSDIQFLQSQGVIHSLQESTSLSLKAFQDLFTGSTSAKCIESPASIWH